MKIFHDAHNFDRYFWGAVKKVRIESGTAESMAPELDLPEYWAAAIPMKCLAAWLPEKPRPKPKSIPLLLLQLKDKRILILTLLSVDAKKALLLLGMPWAKSGEYPVQGQLAMTTSSFGHYFLQIWIWRVLSIIIHVFVFEIVGIIDFLWCLHLRHDPNFFGSKYPKNSKFLWRHAELFGRLDPKKFGSWRKLGHQKSSVMGKLTPRENFYNQPPMAKPRRVDWKSFPEENCR